MGSFSSRVKEELRSVTKMPPHCRQAQIAGKRIYKADSKTREPYEPYEPKKDCCVRAFLRGAFLEAGTVTDPAKSYHFDITCPNKEESLHLITLLARFDIDAKSMERKGQIVVYIKETRQIRDLLTMMGATVSMMNFENARILKEVRGDVNRRVNCDSGNIKKTVNAGFRQIKAIRSLEAAGELDKLSDALYDMARARLENPDATLEELGQTFSPPISKSGVNHRLRKIMKLADQL